MAVIRAESTSWSDTVRQDPFRSILLSTIAVIVVLLSPSSDALPAWFERDIPITMMLFAIAFQRVRQAAALEGATVRAWDRLMRTTHRRRMDELLDGPYLLATFLLPLSAVSAVIFLAVLLLAESATLAHQTLLLRSQRRDLDGAAVPRTVQRRSSLRRIFVWRRRQVATRMILAGTALVQAYRLSGDGAEVVLSRDPVILGSIAVIAVLVFLVDPLRSPLHEVAADDGLHVVEVTAGADIADWFVDRLDWILRASIESGGIDVRRLVGRISDGSGHRVLVANDDGLPVAFIAFQEAAGHAAVWWVCVDPAHRRRGLATGLIERTMHLLGAPELVLIESDLSVSDEELRRARVGMLRRFGPVTRVGGVRWRSAAARSDYDLFAVEPAGPVDDERLRAALRAAATFSLGRHPEDLEAALGTIARAGLRRCPV